jgi:hypothetical protein
MGAGYPLTGGLSVIHINSQSDGLTTVQNCVFSLVTYGVEEDVDHARNIGNKGTGMIGALIHSHVDLDEFDADNQAFSCTNLILYDNGVSSGANQWTATLTGNYQDAGTTWGLNIHSTRGGPEYVTVIGNRTYPAGSRFTVTNSVPGSVYVSSILTESTNAAPGGQKGGYPQIKVSGYGYNPVAFVTDNNILDDGYGNASFAGTVKTGTSAGSAIWYFNAADQVANGTVSAPPGIPYNGLSGCLMNNRVYYNIKNASAFAASGNILNTLTANIGIYATNSFTWNYGGGSLGGLQIYTNNLTGNPASGAQNAIWAVYSNATNITCIASNIVTVSLTFPSIPTAMLTNCCYLQFVWNQGNQTGFGNTNLWLMTGSLNNTGQGY